MNPAVAGGVALVVGGTLLAPALPDRGAATVLVGLATAAAVAAVRRGVRPAPPVPEEQTVDDHEAALRRWVARTTTALTWSQTTRRDWDRHLRPLLARQYGSATGQSADRYRGDPRARAEHRARGEALFGPELWTWVDPDGVVPSRAHEPGPGRDALAEILRRLEQV